MATWVSRVKNNVTLMLPDSTVGDAGTNLSDDLEALQDGLGELDADNITSGTLLPDYGGTGANTAFTAGSIVFAASAGVYAEDNANLFYDATNARLGIGIATPAYPLDVNGDINASGNVNAAAFVVGGNTIIGAGGNIYSAGGYQLVDPSGNIYTPVAGMVIDSSGNLTNIGSINATAAGGSLSVQSTTLYYGNVFTLDAATGNISCGNVASTNLNSTGGIVVSGGPVSFDNSGNVNCANVQATNLNSIGGIIVSGGPLNFVYDGSITQGSYTLADASGILYSQNNQVLTVADGQVMPNPSSSGFYLGVSYSGSTEWQDVATAMGGAAFDGSSITNLSSSQITDFASAVDSEVDSHLAAATSLAIGANASAALGFYGATPVAQPAAPTTLADVIAALKALGLVAT